MEGWEIITALTYIISFGIIYFGTSQTKDFDKYKDWARQEAKARAIFVENGGEVEFGKWYQTEEYELEAIDAIPTPKEKV